MDEKFTIGLVVTNRFGVLNRIAGLYNKRGCNIDSLAVGETENPALSRMTIVSRGDNHLKTQIIRQLNKLYDVKVAGLIEGEDIVSVEHLLIKLKAGTVKNTETISLVNQYGGNILDTGSDYILADLTGTPHAIQAFIEQCKSIGIHELCRSGELALSGGSDKILLKSNQQEETL